MTDKQLKILLLSILRNAKHSLEIMQSLDDLNARGTKMVWTGNGPAPSSFTFPGLLPRFYASENWAEVEDPDTPRVAEAMFGDFIYDLKSMAEALSGDD